MEDVWKRELTQQEHNNSFEYESFQDEESDDEDGKYETESSDSDDEAKAGDAGEELLNKTVDLSLVDSEPEDLRI